MPASRSQRESIALVKKHQVGYIVNTENGKRFAVSTCQKDGLEERLYEESARAMNPKWKSTPLRDDIRAYGKHKFLVEVIHETNDGAAALVMKANLIREGNLRNDKFGYNQ